MADWGGSDYAVVIASATSSLVTLWGMWRLGKKVDGILDKRVSAAEDTGNLAGRHELRAEQKQRRDDATDALVRVAEAEHSNGAPPSPLSQKI